MALAAGVLIALLLTGCGDGGNEPGDDPVGRTPTSSSPSQSAPPGTDY